MAIPLLHMDETELIRSAMHGDDRAFAVLVAKYEPMLRSQVARFRSVNADTEDLYQEGLLGLLAAVRTYSFENRASFGTYASVCVRNRLLSAIRRHSRCEETPMEDIAEYVANDLQDPATLLAERESANRLLGEMRKCLSPKEYEVLLRYMNGNTYRSIAKDMRVSVKTVDNALQRARRKTKAAGLI